IMKVLCKYNNPGDVPSGVPSNFNFGLEVEKEYLVMGMALAEKQLWYLVDEKGKPSFFPYQLFQVVNPSIHVNWYFRLYHEDDGIFPFDKEAMWGYSELCLDANHYEQLLDREGEALDVYFKRKIEFEEELI
ncbi:hypothetical protein, partial [Phaeodactylibacter luteus]|uniref:hypothetical protein n=1 Tax=Phaeodactylibacter luteus TaxID=1564516 RepID=UPI001478BD8F